MKARTTARDPNACRGHFFEIAVAAVIGSIPRGATNPDVSGRKRFVPFGYTKSAIAVDAARILG
jgi:hypothetical protein